MFGHKYMYSIHLSDIFQWKQFVISTRQVKRDTQDQTMTDSYLLDLCLPVTIHLEQESFEADPGWIAGAFFLGLFVGGGIAALIAPICFRDWEKKKVIEPPHDKTNKMVCAPSEDSDQPGHLPSLIRIFAVRIKKAWVLSYPLSAQQRLWSDWAAAQADLSLSWALSHIVGFVMRQLN